MSPKRIMQFDPLQGGPSLAQRASVRIPYREISLDLIERDRNQPRTEFDKSKLEELASSIKRYGIINPILVRARNDGSYLIVAGERRFRAAKMAGLEEVPVVLCSDEKSEEDDILAMQLVENLQRSDLKPLERAQAIGVLKDTHELSIREVAERVGLSKSSVQRSLDLLDLPADLMNALRQGASETKVLELAKIEDEEERAALLEEIDSLTRAEIRSRTRGEEPAKAGSSKSKSKGQELAPDDRRVVDEIQHALGMRVSMKRSEQDSQRGRLSVDFYSEEDLQELFRKLVN